MVFIDIHSHIDFYNDSQIKKIIKNAQDSSVEIIMNNGVNIASNRKITDMLKKYPIIKAALGIYPIDALKLTENEINSEIDFIRKNKEIISAIGEVGLDFKESKEEERQKENFQKFINLSKELGIPIIVHSRKAESLCIKMLENSAAKKVIMHCFCGNISLVKKIISNCWFLSIPASVTFTEHFQNVIKLCPTEQLFCETDSPYLHPFKQKNNEPKFVVEVYKKIAEIKSMPLKEVEEVIYNNYKNIFN